MDYNFKQVEKSGRIYGIHRIPLPQRMIIRFPSSIALLNSLIPAARGFM